jgi:hypothetical protein
MRPRGKRLFALLAALLLLTAVGAVLAQRMGGRGGGFGRGGGGRGGGRGFGRGRFYDLPPRDIFPSNTFTFCRIQYDSDYSTGRRGGGCMTDYPDSDLNFTRRLGEVTTIHVNHAPDGTIKHVVMRLTDPDLYKYPFSYMLEIGALVFSEEERAALKSYLFRGGFLMVDDNWGDSEWENWEYEFSQVLPPDQFPIVDIPLTHELFHIVFDIKEVPQIPAVGNYRYWQQTGITVEPGHNYASGDTKAHCRGVFDKNGRLMCVFLNNTDLGDGWEEESTDSGYFRDFSVKRAYPLGINIFVYAMTH